MGYGLAIIDSEIVYFYMELGREDGNYKAKIN